MKVFTLGFLGGFSGVVSGLIMTSEGAIAQNCASAMTQQALNQCASQAQQRADQSLNDFIADYQTHLSSEGVMMLQHTQASWKLFRRFSCEFESSRVVGGSIYPMIFSGCMAAKATARLKELQELAARCEEEDLNCPALQAPRY